MYPLELEAASGADELDAVDVAILEEDDLCFRNPSTPAFRIPGTLRNFSRLYPLYCVYNGPVL